MNAAVINLTKSSIKLLDFLSPLLDLVIRFWVASIFFKSGLTKIASWESTVALFENEYRVPLLSPQVAALLGTSVELLVPVFLILGLGTRFFALILFIFNIVAVISYPDLGEVGIKDHLYWGFLIAVIALHGPGKISLDYFIARKMSHALH